jgi:hypothetical protein
VAVWVLVHLPHLVPPIVAFAFLARLAVWASRQPPSHYTDEQVEEWFRMRAEEESRLRAPVRRRTALLGLVALGPIVLAFITGIWIYTLSLRGEVSPGWLIWAHIATSIVALAVVTAKSIELGWGRIRGRIEATRPQDAIASLVLLALGAPIAITGVIMYFRPSGGDFAPSDYVHIITGVWWALIVQWHLFRYFGRAIRAATGSASA